MSTFWTTLFVGVLVAMLMFSGLFIVVVVAVALFGGADGIVVALRHHFGDHGKLAGTHYGNNAALNH